MMKNGMLSTLSNATQRVSVLAIYIIAARQMTAHDFGVSSSLVTIAITIGSLASMSLGHTANRTLSRLRAPGLKQTMAIVLIQMAFVVSMLGVFFFAVVSAFMTKAVTGETASVGEIVSIAIIIFMLSFGTCIKGHIWADFRYNLLFASSVISSLVMFCGYFSFMFIGSSRALLHAYTMMALTEAILMSFCIVLPLWRTGALFALPRRKLILPVLRFSLLGSLNGLVITPLKLIMVAIVSNNIGTEAAGRYNVLTQIRNAITFVPSGFSTVILTIMSRARAPLGVLKRSLFLALLALFASVPISLLAYILRPQTHNEDYASLLYLTAVTAVIFAYNMSVSQVFVAMNKLTLAILSNGVMTVTAVFASMVASFLYEITLYDILVIILAAYLLQAVLQVGLVRRITSRQP
jgi:O-antigen/teichoic acid export membrane protein